MGELPIVLCARYAVSGTDFANGDNLLLSRCAMSRTAVKTCPAAMLASLAGAAHVGIRDEGMMMEEGDEDNGALPLRWSDFGYAPTRSLRDARALWLDALATPCAVLKKAMVLRSCYAISGTDVGHLAMQSLCDVRMVYHAFFEIVVGGAKNGELNIDDIEQALAEMLGDESTKQVAS
eukprot:2453823-Rhodomonas_salina.2